MNVKRTYMRDTCISRFSIINIDNEHLIMRFVEILFYFFLIYEGRFCFLLYKQVNRHPCSTRGMLRSIGSAIFIDMTT